MSHCVLYVDVVLYKSRRSIFSALQRLTWLGVPLSVGRPSSTRPELTPLPTVPHSALGTIPPAVTGGLTLYSHLSDTQASALRPSRVRHLQPYLT